MRVESVHGIVFGERFRAPFPELGNLRINPERVT